MALLEEIRLKKNELLHLANHYGVRDIRIFGSVARGEERPESDIDLLIDVAPGTSGFAVGGFQRDASDMLGRFVHIAFIKGQNQKFVARLLQEATML